ncbi:MAG: hypothetical protein IKE61_03760, partial [Coriobacteriales bacterium]|nr:hypothetical protein [Coriobacteriales bacterium]
MGIKRKSFAKGFKQLLAALAAIFVLLLAQVVSSTAYADEADSQAYVRAESAPSGFDYVIASESNGTYEVLAMQNGKLEVVELDALTADTVDKSMLWTLDGTALKSADWWYYLDADEGEIKLAADSAVYAWDCYDGVLSYTDWQDEIYPATFNGNEVALYALEGQIPTEDISVTISVARSAADAVKGMSSGEIHYIAVASDRHGNTTAIASAMGSMPKSTVFVCLDGDMTTNQAFSTSTLQTEVKSGAGLSNATVAVVQDRHDTTNPNDDAGIMFPESYSGVMYTGYNDDGSVAYYAYVASHDSLFNDGGTTVSSPNDAAAFEAWVDEYCSDTSIPIIVIAHVPLHAARNDNPGAVAWNKALNYAATGEETTASGKEVIRNVIFLHGHNHTTENNREYYIPVG